MDAYQLPTGAIMVRETKPSATGVALYARVSSADQRDDVTRLMRQMQRLRAAAAARGYQVVAEVTEIASGLNPVWRHVSTDDATRSGERRRFGHAFSGVSSRRKRRQMRHEHDPARLQNGA